MNQSVLSQREVAGAQVQSLVEFRMSRDARIEAVREHLAEEAREAMAGMRGLVHHIETRAGNVRVVAPCPLAEMLHDVIGWHVVAHSLVELLRYSRDPLAADLRARIASTYAERLAPEFVRLGGDDA